MKKILFKIGVYLIKKYSGKEGYIVMAFSRTISSTTGMPQTWIIRMNIAADAAKYVVPPMLDLFQDKCLQDDIIRNVNELLKQ